MELECTVQTYDWGKRGTDGIVAALVGSTGLEIDPDKPYAELWMGSHPNGPSYLVESGRSLQDYIEQHGATVLGESAANTFGSQLPFLFKVLSVNKALSIQAHPDKTHAEELHTKSPDLYKDSNHKPELAIALTPFQALCGFRPILEIKGYLESIPELRRVIGEEESSNFLLRSDRETLKSCFRSLMTRDPKNVDFELSELVKRVSRADEDTRRKQNASVLERLYTDYPGDVGCFGIYFFNYITLEPGEAIFLGPNEPHAYLYGDCIECMACSDNVVRAGLTPKHKDVETLVQMLTYDCQLASAKRFQPVQEDECTQVFRPPVPDFAVAKISVPEGKKNYSLIRRCTCSILLVISGTAEISTSSSLLVSPKTVKPGHVLFVPAKEEMHLHVPSETEPVILFQAFANV